MFHSATLVSLSAAQRAVHALIARAVAASSTPGGVGPPEIALGALSCFLQHSTSDHHGLKQQNAIDDRVGSGSIDGDRSSCSLLSQEEKALILQLLQCEVNVKDLCARVQEYITCCTCMVPRPIGFPDVPSVALVTRSYTCIDVSDRGCRALTAATHIFVANSRMNVWTAVPVLECICPPQILFYLPAFWNPFLSRNHLDGTEVCMSYFVSRHVCAYVCMYVHVRISNICG